MSVPSIVIGKTKVLARIWKKGCWKFKTWVSILFTYNTFQVTDKTGFSNFKRGVQMTARHSLTKLVFYNSIELCTNNACRKSKLFGSFVNM